MIEIPIRIEKANLYDEVEILNPPKKFNEIKLKKYTRNNKIISKIIKLSDTTITVEGFGKFRRDGWAMSYAHNPEKPFSIRPTRTTKMNPITKI